MHKKFFFSFRVKDLIKELHQLINFSHFNLKIRTQFLVFGYHAYKYKTILVHHYVKLRFATPSVSPNRAGRDALPVE